MARKARLTRTRLSFIARDDSAIGLEEGEERRKAYNQYLQDQNQIPLAVDEREGPTWYILRPFRAENWTEVTEAYTAVALAQKAAEEAAKREGHLLGEDADDASIETSEEETAPAPAPADIDEETAEMQAELAALSMKQIKGLMKTHRHHIREALRDRIVAVVAHPIVDEVGKDGEPVVRLVSWEEGTPAPEGLIEDILAQDALVGDMLVFLVHAASLTERKKKL